MGRRIVGIDLGTTHTAVAEVDPEGSRRPEIFEIPRLTGPFRVAQSPTLPSVLYAPMSGEIEPHSEWLVGDYARARSREVAGRTVVSAKSWLSYSAVDRNASILPWGSDDVKKLSPLDASATILGHVRSEWDRAHPREPLREHTLVLTVPASFDPTARKLTLEAAKQVGLAVRLLEEPQAAFYDYLERAGEGKLEVLLAQAKAKGRATATVLVCDVGGGTTDLTLLSLAKSPSGAVSIERIAVGKHLLLGGDNMDLALAHQLERKLTRGGERLPIAQFSKLTLLAQAAKERLLEDPSLAQFPISLAATGSALVGATKTTEVTREEVETLIVGGFFPHAEVAPTPQKTRTGLIGFGLPYETDPAITRHVGAFLHRHLGAAPELDGLLLNGGVFRSQHLVKALIAALQPLREGRVTVLHQPHPDLAVARGATVYGLSLLGHGLRIGGGSAFGYYVAVDAGASHDGRAICVVPRGSREAETHQARAAQLRLTVGKPVRFELYSSDNGAIHAPGELVKLDEGFELTCPVVAHFDDPKPREVPVILEGELSAVGTLELACVSSLGERERFALAFELRGQEPELGQKPAEPSDASHGLGVERPSQRPVSGRLEEVAREFHRLFGKGASEASLRDVKDLFRNLEKGLGPRASWDLELCRSLFDAAWAKHPGRKRSLDHERLYFMVLGFTLRPGFGHPLDRTRGKQLATLFAQGLSFPGEIRGWQQFFIAYRRAAAGFDEAEQTQMAQLLLPHLAPGLARGKQKGSFRPLAEPEMLHFASFLERLPHSVRAALGEAIVERTYTKSDPWLFSALGRVGARVPVYASLHHALPAHIVEGYLDQLLRSKWDGIPTIPAAVVQMGRITGDRTRDIRDSLRQDLCRRLEKLGFPEAQWLPLREQVEVAEQERTNSFGEELPVGLLWVEA